MARFVLNSRWMRRQFWFGRSGDRDLTASDTIGLNRHWPAGVHIGISLILLVVVSVLDLARPFDRSWSILYLLVSIYAGQTLKGWSEFVIQTTVFFSVFLVPLIFRPEMVWPGTGLFYRTTGVIAGFVLLRMMWDRRRFIKALQRANSELESTIAARTYELRSLNESLQHEIAERRQTEETIEMMRFCIERAGDAVLWVSPEGKIVYVNDAACSERGYTRQELLSMTIFDLDVEPDYQPQQWAEHFRELKRRKTMTFETRHRAKDGRIFPIEVSANYLIVGNKELNFAFVRNITIRKQIDEQLRTSRQRLELLSRQLITTQETERRHLARELHDEIGQVLTAIKMNLQRTKDVAEDRIKGTLDENLKMVDGAIGQVRNLSLQLRPPQLDELGLVAALHWLVKQQSQIAGFDGRLDVDLGETQIPVDLQTVCFRIAQEALTNAVRHANPSQIFVKLTAAERELHLSIADDGTGFNVSESRMRAMNGGSIGLISMQERASLVGGSTEFESNFGQGTKIHVRIPLSSSVNAR